MPPKRSFVAAYIARTAFSSATSACCANASPSHARRGLLGGGEIDVGDADAGALAREHLRGLASHPAAGAGDHRDLPVEPSHEERIQTRRARTNTA